ncbi:MAG TPA: sodium-dependent transporter [Steroidobacteraceae bacterium]|nr:sodium-dependent transporter [Steroidobacteraceae bacterium]
MEKKQWSSNLLFLITAIGTEAGIANFWKFTYLAGQNGGATFVFVYFAALATLAVPALIAEMLIGQYCGRSVVGCMRVLVERDKISPAWKSYGVIALAGIFLVLSFYFVICGWMLRYFLLGVTGSFAKIQAPQALEMYATMLASPVQMLACSGFFILLTTIIVAHGVNQGIERVSGILTPLRFLILIGLCAYAAVVGNTSAAANFLLSFHLDRLSADVVLIAVGQAFFSLGVGAGVMMTVGAYMKREYSIVKSVFTVAFAQGLVAVLAGFSIFPLVFAYGLEATHGPGLVFVTLPVAFGQMPYGGVFGTIMFLVLSFAGLTATIVLLEAIVAFLEEYTSLSRAIATYSAGFAIWVAGFVTVLSFSTWKNVHPLQSLGFASSRTPFELIDYLASNIMLPLGGLMVALMAGWALSREVVLRESGIGSGTWFKLWYGTIRYIVPLALGVVFLAIQG